MPGPKDSDEALVWIQSAMDAGRYVSTYHVTAERSPERRISLDDIRMAISHAERVEPYDGQPQHDGTCWRLYGPDENEERTIAVGVEAFLDKRRRRIVLCTVIEFTNA